MEETKVAHSAESTHWYSQDGKPAYTYLNKKGEEKPTTLRQARTSNLVPGVSTILGMANKPGLQRWLQEQVLLSALTSTRKDDEPEQDYINRIILEAGEQSKKARETGTAIHSWVQSGFEREQIHSDGVRYFESARDTILAECGEQKWGCEESFAWDGYGGKADIYCDLFLLDFKTTEKPLEGIKIWEEHAMQLAAYLAGLGLDETTKCGICYINTISAEAKIIWISKEEIEKGWKMFRSLKSYWYAKTQLGEE